MRRLILLYLSLSYFAATAQCYENRHNTSRNAAWISCEKTENPNPIRGNSHWIQYDLKHTYSLGQVHFWNANFPKNLEVGLSEAAIDYSLDGENWEEWGTFNLDQASGSTIYEGDNIVDLEGIDAKYILITGIENHGGQCFGFAEIKIDVEDAISSIDDQKIGIEFSVFPNPAVDFIQVKLDEITDGHISISTADGKIIHTQNLNTDLLKINTQSYLSGSYNLTLTADGKVTTKTFLVQQKND